MTPLTPQQQRHFDEFMQATRGLSAYRVAAAIRGWVGIRWAGCSKSDMAREYAEAKAPKPGGLVVYRMMARIDIKAIPGEVRRLFPPQ